jgi:hypothetical protein
MKFNGRPKFVVKFCFPFENLFDPRGSVEFTLFNQSADRLEF